MCCLFSLLILISHKGESRTLKAAKMKIFVSTINDSQPLKVIIKNFVPDAKGALNPPDRLCTLFVSVVHSIIIMLE